MSSVPRSRHLDWDGCWNVRDFGGLPARSGRATRFGGIVRADSLDRLTPTGWSALTAYGIGTIVDLRNDHELAREARAQPPGVARVHLPLDCVEDREFWDHWEAQPPPLFYRPHLERFPERTVAVVRAIARARPGGVLVHCGSGRDRAGLVAMVVLALVGVTGEAIVADFELSEARLARLYARPGEEDEGASIATLLERAGTTAGEVVADTLASLDLEAHLRSGGLGEGDVEALRERLLEPSV
ncbi:MAG: protein-tyrosine phosphatase [Thermoleophilaceae bacterium]|nr:protein-tyrosine phosphatase [Thermoleophilaceae bacterium]